MLDIKENIKYFILLQNWFQIKYIRVKDVFNEMNCKTYLISNTVMEDDIQNYPSTVMFCGYNPHGTNFFPVHKGIEFCLKLWVSNFNIVATQCRRPLIFQTLKDIRSNNVSLKYQRFTS